MAVSPKTYVAVVDDDESLCRAMARLLRAGGLEPVAYHSAEAFLDDRKRPDFDCLVLDIRLTGMSGIELSRRLLSSGSTTPVVFLTAVADDPEAHDEALLTPFASYLSKTDSAEVVLTAIRAAIQRHGLSERQGEPA